MALRIIVALMCLAALAVPGVAFADPPERTVTTDPHASFVRTTCGFAVLVQPVGTTITRTWYDDEGQGPVEWILTNQESGTSITIKIPGPSVTTYNPDGSSTTVGTGPWGFARFNPADTEEAGMFLVHGRFTVDAVGNFDFSGRVENLCPLLA